MGFRKGMCAVSLALALGLGGAFAAGQPRDAYAAPPSDDLHAAQVDLVRTSDHDITVMASKSGTLKKPSSVQIKAFRKASGDFAIDLFRSCVAAKGKSANVTVAPMSAMNMLAFAANGAAGTTQRQMRNVLANGAKISTLNRSLGWYNQQLTNTSKAKMSNANSIWYQNDGSLTMKRAFTKKGKRYYGAEVKPADFSSAKTVADINDWVSKNTDKMIPRIVDQLDKTTRIAIINAQSFDAKWKVPYDNSDVAKARFTLANGKKRTVEMMRGIEQRYIEGKNVTGFIKPYAKGYSYVALLPKKGVSLKKYVSTLTGATFRKLVTSAKRENVRIGLPKYAISYSNDAMEKQLSALGIKLAFSTQANFSKMASDKTGNLYIDQVIQKTKVIVDERGTKAAAVTGGFMKASSALLPDVKTVILNRPFVYAIIDNTTKLPLFIGTVNTIGK